MIRRSPLVFVAFALACGDDPSSVPNEPLRTVAQTPSPATWATETTVASTAISALGTDDAHRPVLGTSDGVFVIERSTASARLLYDDGSNPILGTIHTVAPRKDGGAWVGSDTGLFIVDTLYTLPSLFQPEGDVVQSIAEPTQGPLAGLWLGTPAGLFSQTGDALFEYAFEDHTGSVTHLAFETQGRFGLIVQAGQLYTLESDAGQLWSAAAPMEDIEVNGLASGLGAVWAATTQGVLRFEGEGWTHFPLSASGSEPATQVAVNPSSQAAWVRVADALIKIDGTTLETLPLDAATTPAGPIVVDGLGDVYAPDTAGLKRLGTGDTTATRFAADLAPWIEENCAQCHAGFTTYASFASRADDALARVRSGDMPRCNGGAVCPEDQQLTPADYAILEQWIQDGLSE